MASQIALLIVILVFRLKTLLLLAASLAVIATDKFSAPDFIGDSPQKFTFKDVYAYRFVLAVAAIGCAYTLVQIPFAILSIARRNRVTGAGSNQVALLRLICADVVFALLIMAGAAAGFGYTFDRKHDYDLEYKSSSVVTDPRFVKLHNDIERYFKLAYVSAGLMLYAAVSMAVIIMTSVHALVR